MLHARVCVPRQYARFCGIVHGEKTRKFFAKLVRLGYASMYDCRYKWGADLPPQSPGALRAVDEADTGTARYVGITRGRTTPALVKIL